MTLRPRAVKFQKSPWQASQSLATVGKVKINYYYLCTIVKFDALLFTVLGF